MNKKGFTTIELVVSFVMVVVLLASLIGFTITYRSKVQSEEIKSQLLDFKNTITKAVYDDMVDLNYTSMSYCVGQENCVVMVDESGVSHVLKVENSCTTSSCSGGSCELHGCAVYLVYDGIKYMLPDSDLNTYYKRNNTDTVKVSETASNLWSFNLKNEQSIYSLKMVFRHFQVKDDIEILITIN